MKKNYLTLCAGAIIALILALYLVAFQLSIHEKAVLTMFGKSIKSLSEPGLYWKLPWPFQKVYIFDARLVIDEGIFEETYTKDGKNIIVSTSIGWNISEPEKFLKSIGNIDDAKRNLDGLVRTFKNGVIGRHDFAQMVSTNKENIAFEQIEQEMLEPIEQEALLRYGIKIEFLYITRIGLPEETTVKVFERMKKERLRIAERYRSEGDAKANEIRAAAKSERDQIIAKAEAKAKRIRGEGDAAAAKYYSKFEENKELAVFLKKIETLQQVLKQKSTVILNTQTPPFDLLNEMQEIKK